MNKKQQFMWVCDDCGDGVKCELRGIKVKPEACPYTVGCFMYGEDSKGWIKQIETITRKK